MYTPEERRIINMAIELTNRSLTAPDATLFKYSEDVKDYLKVRIGHHRNEVFHVLFLDNQYRLIHDETLFMGTINKTPVYARVVMQKALEYNAANIILSHNHPTGDSEPSRDDISITQELKMVLDMIDVKVLDHIIVGRECSSFVEMKLL